MQAKLQQETHTHLHIWLWLIHCLAAVHYTWPWLGVTIAMCFTSVCHVKGVSGHQSPRLCDTPQQHRNRSPKNTSKLTLTVRPSACWWWSHISESRWMEAGSRTLSRWSVARRTQSGTPGVSKDKTGMLYILFFLICSQMRECKDTQKGRKKRIKTQQSWINPLTALQLTSLTINFSNRNTLTSEIKIFWPH